MTAIVPLSSGKLPAYLAKRTELAAAINGDVVGDGLGYGVLSIKGKVFTLVKGNERKVLTKPEDPDEVLQFVNLTVLRANTKSRVFYAKAYVEGEDNGEMKRPDCYSRDGIAPAEDARTPQAKKCQVCPHAVWGSKVSTDGQGSGKGTACTVNTRLAVVDPDTLVAEQTEPYLLRVPAGSRANFADVVRAADSRGLPYNALVLKVGFDKEAPAPKLTFKLTGLVSDAAYEKVQALHDDTLTKAIVGLVAHKEPEDTASSVSQAEVDAALAGQTAVENAKASAKADPKPRATAKAKPPAPAPAPVDDPAADLDALLNGGETKAAAPTPAPSPAPKPAANVQVTDASNLMDELDALLGGSDD